MKEDTHSTTAAVSLEQAFAKVAPNLWHGCKVEGDTDGALIRISITRQEDGTWFVVVKRYDASAQPKPICFGNGDSLGVAIGRANAAWVKGKFYDDKFRKTG